MGEGAGSAIVMAVDIFVILRAVMLAGYHTLA